MKNDFESKHTTELTRYRIECARKMKGKVLDVGGGMGVYLPYFSSSDVTGLDISEEAMKKANYQTKIVGDACHMPFDNSSFDSIWACGVCMYMNIDDFVKEAKRVLKTNGKIIITIPNPDSPWSKYIKMLGMKVWEDNKNGNTIYNLYTVKQLEKYGKLSGEVRFLPTFLDRLVRNRPRIWHTMMLEIDG